MTTFERFLRGGAQVHEQNLHVFFFVFKGFLAPERQQKQIKKKLPREKLVREQQRRRALPEPLEQRSRQRRRHVQSLQQRTGSKPTAEELERGSYSGGDWSKHSALIRAVVECRWSWSSVAKRRTFARPSLRVYSHKCVCVYAESDGRRSTRRTFPGGRLPATSIIVFAENEAKGRERWNLSSTRYARISTCAARVSLRNCNGGSIGRTKPRRTFQIA